MNETEIRQRLGQLEQEHRDLDSTIETLGERIGHDQLLLARLKKRKLLIKDEIFKLCDQLVPDIIA